MDCREHDPAVLFRPAFIVIIFVSVPACTGAGASHGIYSTEPIIEPRGIFRGFHRKTAAAAIPKNKNH